MIILSQIYGLHAFWYFVKSKEMREKCVLVCVRDGLSREREREGEDKEKDKEKERGEKRRGALGQTNRKYFRYVAFEVRVVHAQSFRMKLPYVFKFTYIAGFQLNPFFKFP